MDVILERKHRVLRITLNRPEKRNALSSSMCAAIVEVIDSIQDDPHIGSVLLAANGHVFCAGMDLEESTNIDAARLARLHQQLFSIGRRSLKPLVICVNGAALGGGLGLVAQGHIVVASSGSAFGLPEIRLGLWPLMIYRSVEAALGPRRTLELSLTGRLIEPEDALAWGLINKVTHPEEAFDRAKGLANDLAKASPKAIEAGFRLLQRSYEATVDEADAAAIELRRELMATPDFHEGVAAFKEKREPRWPSIAP